MPLEAPKLPPTPPVIVVDIRTEIEDKIRAIISAEKNKPRVNIYDPNTPPSIDTIPPLPENWSPLMDTLNVLLNKSELVRDFKERHTENIEGIEESIGMSHPEENNMLHISFDIKDGNAYIFLHLFTYELSSEPIQMREYGLKIIQEENGQYTGLMEAKEKNLNTTKYTQMSTETLKNIMEIILRNLEKW